MARVILVPLLVLAVLYTGEARQLLLNTAAYGYQDTDPNDVQAYDSTTYAPQQQAQSTSLQAKQQPATTSSSSSSDSLPSFELPSLPQIKAFFDSLPKPPSMGPGPFDALFAPAPAPSQAQAPITALG